MLLGVALGLFAQPGSGYKSFYAPLFRDTNKESPVIVLRIIGAIVGKVMPGWTVFGQPSINQLAIGVGMIPRDEVRWGFAGIGSASVLSKPLKAAILRLVGRWSKIAHRGPDVACLPGFCGCSAICNLFLQTARTSSSHKQYSLVLAKLFGWC